MNLLEILSKLILPEKDNLLKGLSEYFRKFANPEELMMEFLNMKHRLEKLEKFIPREYEIAEAEKTTCPSCKGSGDWCDGDGYHYGNYHTCETCKGTGHKLKLTAVVIEKVDPYKYKQMQKLNNNSAT